MLEKKKKKKLWIKHNSKHKTISTFEGRIFN